MPNYRLAVLGLCFLATTAPIYAARATPPDVSYLDAMPDVARVLKDHADPDPLKTVAMQHAAMEVLKDAITNRTWQSGAGDPKHRYRPRIPAEEAKFEDYRQALIKAAAQLNACKAPACDEPRRNSLWNRQQQGKFRQSTMEKYFKGPWLDEHNRIMKARLIERRDRR